MINIDKNLKTPIYLQIYEQIRNEIIEGERKAHERLPATRDFAEDYQISRNSVLNAYQQLESEGFVSSKIGSGFYVEDLPERYETPIRENRPDAIPQETQTYRYDFRYGSIEPNVYRSRSFRKALKDALFKLEEKEILSDEHPQGLYSLRQAICDHLNEVRGVKAGPEQVIITSGHRYSLKLLSEYFSSGSYSASIEDPGHRDVKDIFLQAGCQIHPIPLDENGIRIDVISKHDHTLACLTPSHQFPMGAILPIARRLQLLQWADETDSFIIEDDYDSELRYKERPVPALYSLDRKGRVIYLGSFSKSLSPDLRISYIVLPEDLPIDPKLLNSSTSLLIQMTLDEYLRSNEYRKRISRIRNSLRKKHNHIIDVLNEHYRNRIRICGSGGGTHFVLQIPLKKDHPDLLETFRKENCEVYPISDLYLDPKQGKEDMIMIGYGGIRMSELDEYLNHLKNAIDQLI